MQLDEGQNDSRAAAVFALGADSIKGFFAVDGLHPAALDLVIAAIESGADLGKLGQVASHGVFDEIVRRAARCGGKFVKPGLGFRFEANDHETESKTGAGECQS
jgi:hypothetical protein